MRTCGGKNEIGCVFFISNFLLYLIILNIKEKGFAENRSKTSVYTQSFNQS
jgi:hypothetical protein